VVDYKKPLQKYNISGHRKSQHRPLTNAYSVCHGSLGLSQCPEKVAMRQRFLSIISAIKNQRNSNMCESQLHTRDYEIVFFHFPILSRF